MLRVTFTIEPFGIRDCPRQIYEIEIANVDTNWSNQADYTISCKGQNLKRKLKGRLKSFDRDRGAVALVQESLQLLLKSYGEKLKSPQNR